MAMDECNERITPMAVENEMAIPVSATENGDESSDEEANSNDDYAEEN